MNNSMESLTVMTKTKYKIVLLGDQYVGKTALIDRFVNDRFEMSYDVFLTFHQFRPQLESISSSETLFIIVKHIVYNYGILLDSKDSKVLFQVI